MTEIEQVRRHLRTRYQDKYANNNTSVMHILGIPITELQEKEEFLCAIYMLEEHHQFRISMLEQDRRMQKMFAEAKKL